jgi:hypothetical protein
MTDDNLKDVDPGPVNADPAANDAVGDPGPIEVDIVMKNILPPVGDPMTHLAVHLDEVRNVDPDSAD